MPTPLQLAVRRGIHPTTEAFAMELYCQRHFVGARQAPHVAWEFATEAIRAQLREMARSWIIRGLSMGLAMDDYDRPRRGKLGWCYPELEGTRLRIC